jgi:GNAT superfamily N-acetyltransferase
MSKDCPALPPGHVVRDATMADIRALESCYRQASHAERIRAADGRTLRYFVVEVDREVVGFGRLVLAEPLHQRKVGYLPRIVNLNVRQDMRGRGLATSLIQAMEQVARAAGHRVLYIGVHPQNAQALPLYRRLGYEPVEGQPAREPLESVDPGSVHRSDARQALYLAKFLAQ